MNNVAVIGGVNVDIRASSDNALNMRDSNPGHVSFSLGGVAYNIARNLALMDVDVSFCSLIGDDINSALIRADAAKYKRLDFSRVGVRKNFSCGSYVYMEGPSHDMEVAVCDAAVTESIDEEYLAPLLNRINAADAVVIDTNLSMHTLDYITANVTVPIFADPISAAKAERIRPFTGRLYAIKPNEYEIEVLGGAKTLIASGIKQVFVSIGPKGLIAADANESLILNAPDTEVINTTGAGDAMMAGIVKGYLNGYDLRRTAELSLAAASCALKSTETINAEISKLGEKGF